MKSNSIVVSKYYKNKKIKSKINYTFYTIKKIYKRFKISQTGQCIEKNVSSSLKFLNNFKDNAVRTGAIAPSSKTLAKYITDIALLDERKCIVELGSGTGSFTKEIIKKKSKGSLFFSLEINKYFAEKTKTCCPDATIHNDSAENIQKYLKEAQKDECDCIISGLPWSCFDEKYQTDLIDRIYESLERNGEFLTFAYLQSSFLPQGIKFKKLLNDRFKVVIQTKIIWNNLPPAFVYHCTK